MVFVLCYINIIGLYFDSNTELKHDELTQRDDEMEQLKLLF